MENLNKVRKYATVIGDVELKAEPNDQSETICIIPDGSVVEVVEVVEDEQAQT